MFLTVCPLCGPGSIPGRSGILQGIFPLLITFFQPVLSQRGRKWLNLPPMAPHILWTSVRQARVQRTMAEKITQSLFHLKGSTQTSFIGRETWWINRSSISHPYKPESLRRRPQNTYSPLKANIDRYSESVLSSIHLRVIVETDTGRTT